MKKSCDEYMKKKVFREHPFQFFYTTTAEFEAFH